MQGWGHTPQSGDRELHVCYPPVRQVVPAVPWHAPARPQLRRMSALQAVRQQLGVPCCAGLQPRDRVLDVLDRTSVKRAGLLRRLRHADVRRRQSLPQQRQQPLDHDCLCMLQVQRHAGLTQARPVGSCLTPHRRAPRFCKSRTTARMFSSGRRRWCARPSQTPRTARSWTMPAICTTSAR